MFDFKELSFLKTMLLASMLLLTPVSVWSKTEQQKAVHCEELLSSLLDSASYPQDLSLSQAHRLSLFLNSLTEAQREKLLETAMGKDLASLAYQIRSENPDSPLPANLQDNALLQLLILDLSDLSDAFPGLLGLPQASTALPQILSSILQSEADPHIRDTRILETQSKVPRLRRTIDYNLENLVRQATYEYEGMRFGATGWELFKRRIGRWFSPSYSKVRRLVSAGNFYQRQLDRLLYVDSLIIEQALSRIQSESLSEQEVQELSMLVLNSPDEVRQIVASLNEIFGEAFQDGRIIDIGAFNISEAAAKARQENFRNLQQEFDQLNLSNLVRMNEIISEARSRRGLAPRTEKDFAQTELQLYFGARERALSLLGESYRSTVDRLSQETYTIEKMNVRRVPNGTDSKGRQQWRTEIYYTSHQRTPSFEEILSNSFYRGDRNVSGLTEIQQRTKSLRESESPARHAIFRASDVLGEVSESYALLLTNPQMKQGKMDLLRTHLKEIDKLIHRQQEYVRWSDAQIHEQYRRDIIANFRRRNELNLERLQVLHAHITVTLEALERGLPQLRPSFAHRDLSDWKKTLRYYRNRNYLGKTGLALGALATPVGIHQYHSSREFNELVQHWLPWLAELLDQIPY